MKQVLLVVLAIYCHLYSYSQNVFPSYGKVGIGISSPVAELHIVTGNWNKLQIDGTNTSGLDRIGIKSSGFDLFFGAAGSAHATTGHVKTSGSFYSFNGPGGISLAATNGSGHLRFYTGGQADQHERFRIEQQGKLFAFGLTRGSVMRDSALTMDPTTKELQLTPLSLTKITFLDTRSVSTIPTLYNSSLQVHLKNNSAVGLANEGSGMSSVIGVRGGSADATGKSHEMAFSDNNQVWFRSGFSAAWGGWKKLVFDSAGTIRMGTSQNRSNLHVNGDILTRKLKVTQNNWPDYVFANGYKLMPIYEVERYINEENHLPDVPSATQVEKEGLDVGDAQAILLRKIEELTLYLIDQQKQIDMLKEENRMLSDVLLRNTKVSEKK